MAVGSLGVAVGRVAETNIDKTIQIVLYKIYSLIFFHLIKLNFHMYLVL